MDALKIRIGSAGRIAGLIYLAMILTGTFSLGFAPKELFVSGDPAASWATIQAKETVFRLHLAAGFACYALFVVLAIALRRVFVGVNDAVSMLMVGFVLVSVPIAYAALAGKMEILALLDRGAATDAVAIVEAGLDRYKTNIRMATVFWGLWLGPLAFLILKSGRIPRILGAFLAFGCVGYLAKFFGPMVFPPFADMPISAYVTTPASIGEIGTCLWLLAFGAKGPGANDPQPDPA